MNGFNPSTALRQWQPAPDHSHTMARALLQILALSNQGITQKGTTVNTTTPKTARITLTLTTHTIKALRLLALLKDESQNDVAEALLIAGGLHASVDTEWKAEKPALDPVASPQHRAAPVSTPKPQVPAVPDYKRDWMPEIPKPSDESLSEQEKEKEWEKLFNPPSPEPPAPPPNAAKVEF